MTPTVLAFVAVCIAGGVGAALRFVVDGVVRSRLTTVFPVGTTIINLSGSLVLGVLVGLASNAVLPGEWESIIGTGLMGGYTTFSTASVETVRLLQLREHRLGLLNGLGTLVATVALGPLGLWLGTLLQSPGGGRRASRGGFVLASAGLSITGAVALARHPETKTGRPGSRSPNDCVDDPLRRADRI